MPQIKNYLYLLDYTKDMGLYSSGGMGIIPLSYVEIKAYRDLMGLNLTPFEVSTIRDISIAYTSQYNNNYSDTVAPFSNVITVNEFDKLINQANSFKRNI